MVKEVRYLFLCHFWSLYNWATIFEGDSVITWNWPKPTTKALWPSNSCPNIWYTWYNDKTHNLERKKVFKNVISVGKKIVWRYEELSTIGFLLQTLFLYLLRGPLKYRLDYLFEWNLFNHNNRQHIMLIWRKKQSVSSVRVKKYIIGTYL